MVMLTLVVHSFVFCCCGYKQCLWLQFLAFRLSEVKLSCEHLTADLNMTMVRPETAVMVMKNMGL